jgi:hypothetical protein
VSQQLPQDSEILFTTVVFRIDKTRGDINVKQVFLSGSYAKKKCQATFDGYL